MKAPFEEVEVPKKKFDVEVSYLLRKRTSIETDDYEIEHDDFERQAFINTELTDWESAYNETHFTMEEMLDELRRYVEFEMITVEPCSRRVHRSAVGTTTRHPSGSACSGDYQQTALPTLAPGV